jgi:hypothetical protein
LQPVVQETVAIHKKCHPKGAPTPPTGKEEGKDHAPQRKNTSQNKTKG